MMSSIRSQDQIVICDFIACKFSRQSSVGNNDYPVGNRNYFIQFRGYYDSGQTIFSHSLDNFKHLCLGAYINPSAGLI